MSHFPDVLRSNDTVQKVSIWLPGGADSLKVQRRFDTAVVDFVTLHLTLEKDGHIDVTPSFQFIMLCASGAACALISDFWRWLIAVNHEYVACSGVSKFLRELPWLRLEEQAANNNPEASSQVTAMPLRSLRNTDEP
jgi:hypothetical protein